MSTGSYAAPDDLPEEEAEAKCETDVVIKLEEPNKTGPDNSGFSWIGVKEVDVILSGGGNTYSGKTGSDGTVTLSDVTCGAYVIRLDQDEFKISEVDGGLSMTVSATSKSGREKTIKIKRQILTIEMLRLPTEYIEAVRLNRGKAADPSIIDDPYGHHWLKIYATEADANDQRPRESYGWWPTAGAGFPDMLTGVPGELNGTTNYGGTSTRDPYHTKYERDHPSLEDAFFPYVTNGKTADEYKADLKSYAQGFSGAVSNQWSWRSDGGGWHCKTFQSYIMTKSYVWKRIGVGVGSYGWSTST